MHGGLVSAYYNENDKGAVEWLHNLMRRNLIPSGEIDERSIVDVQPADVRGYRHVHLFAGIGGWAYAASLARWPRETELWTASCPCQPFSSAGHKRGRNDPRHLWPHVARLVAANRPAYLVGEQTSSALGYAWFDEVAADLEASRYACRAVDIPALSVGAPHRRQRLWWVAVPQDGEHAVANPPSSGGDVTFGKAQERASPARPAPPNQTPANLWAGGDFVECADGQRRLAKPGIRWMADGLPAGMVRVRSGSTHTPEATRYVDRAGLWRGFGNAVVPQLAAEILSALLEDGSRYKGV